MTIEYIDQTFFIDIDEYYNIQDDINSLNKGISTLIFSEFQALDEKYEKITLNELRNFHSIAEWDVFKDELIKKLSLVEKYVELYLIRAAKLEEGTNEKDAHEYWDDQEEDEYPKNSFESFEEWFGSNDFYEWDSMNNQFSWDDFSIENKDIYEALKTEYYIDNYGNIFSRKIEEDFDSIREIIHSKFEEIDSDIKEKVDENKYEVIDYIFQS